MALLHRTITLDDGFKVGVVQSRIRRTDIPTLVWLHGWSVSAVAYDEMLNCLENRSSFYVIALDLPDHGESSALPWGHSIADMAYIVRCALDKLGVTEAVMVGHSLGGGVVTQFAARYPESTLGAILIDAAAGQHHHEAIQVAFTVEGVLRAAELVTGALRDIIGDIRMAAEKRSVRELLSLGRRLGKSVSGLPMLRAGIALLKHESDQALRQIRKNATPVVVIHGGDDRIISQRAAIQAAHSSGGCWHILAGCNHSWMISDPARAAEVIAEHAWRIVRKAA